MSDFNIVNLNNFTWQLNVALLGVAFAIFSLVYNEKYIYYGLVTAAFGISGHIVYLFFEWIFLKEGTKSKYYWLAHLANATLLVAWIAILLLIY